MTQRDTVEVLLVEDDPADVMMISEALGQSPLTMGLLAEMKADRDLLAIPVAVLTTSQAESDIQSSYSLHANSYVTKPVDFDSFSAAIRQIQLVPGIYPASRAVVISVETGLKPRPFGVYLKGGASGSPSRSPAARPWARAFEPVFRW